MKGKEDSYERDSRRWAVILAGGEGERLQPLVERLLGRRRPKQYCALDGDETMLQKTCARAARFAREDRIVTVIGAGHRAHIDKPIPGLIVEQPANRGTAPGLFLPAAHVYAADPEATLVILPSDHRVYPEGRFLGYLQLAARAAEELGDRIVLLGAEADSPETDYGWIAPAGQARRLTWGSVLPVERFHEKPSPEAAEAYLERGYYWNTMAMAVKAKALWALGAEVLPSMMERFERIKADRGEANILAAYKEMPAANFSKDIVQRRPERAVVLPMRGVEWSDLGRPERVAAAIEPRAPGLALA